VASTRKVGRNDRCPCGSGKKYKSCCALKQGGLSLGHWAAILAMAAAAAVLVFFLYNLTQDEGARIATCPPGQVWSPEHGHCHAPGS
jgi:hypothetical protein